MIRIAILVGSSRPGRRADQVAAWVLAEARRSPALKNAIDYLFAEWDDKAAGFVSYGLGGGVRAVEQLLLTLAEVKVACVRSQVALSLSDDFAINDMAQPGTFAPAERHRPHLDRLLGELAGWAGALQALRSRSATSDQIAPERSVTA